MSRLHRLLQARRLILSVAGLMVLVGALSYATMARQEDPFFPYRGGVIRTIFPGADAERIRELVVRHLEREIGEIADLNFVRSTVRNNVALTTVVMQDYIYDTEAKWDEVRRAIKRAQALFPPDVEEPVLDDRVITTTTASFSIVGSTDLQAMTLAAKVLRDELMKLGNLIRIDIYGDPGEQVTIALEDETAKRHQISANYLAAQLRGRTQLLGSGTLVTGSTRLTLKPETEFRDIEELRNTPIALPHGDVVPLAALAQVWLGAVQPQTARMWHDGQSAVIVDLIADQNKLNSVAYGQRIRAAVERARPKVAPLLIEEMFFQPDRVESRLDGLSQSLLFAVGIILAVLMLAMGIRLALLVAVILPTVAAISVAIYALGGGVLHQMAVTGMIIALGILVDNAIVMIEEVQYQLNKRHPPLDAAILAIRNLAKPLAAATGTTLAVFVPLVLSKSGVADFTRAVPLMIMTSLVISYLFALLVTPMLGERFLRPQLNSDGSAKTGLPEKFGGWAGNMGSRHAWLVLGIALLLMVGSGVYAKYNLESEFFPQADRDQVLIDIDLSEGTTQAETTRVARILEQELRNYNDVLQVHVFIGNSGPRFYYNLLRQPDQPNRARLVVRSSGLQGNLRIIQQIRQFSEQQLPEAAVVPKILSQGPPIDAPIEVRIFNTDPVALAEATEMVLQAVQAANGAVDVSHNLGLGAPQLQFEIDDALALQYGVNRADIAHALLSRSQGLPIGLYRGSDEPAPIRVRSMAGENFNPAELDSVLVFNQQGEGIPLGAVATTKLSWQPGAIYSYNQRRYALVSSELAIGKVFSEVLDEIKPKLKALTLPAGTSYEFGGAAEASGDANSAIAGVAPLGAVLLLFFLLWQFNSYRRLAIVLMSIPLAFVGVFPGLALLGIPFGFQPMLGSIALIGIVVNNAIVLIDVLDANIAAGQRFEAAITNAVQRRTRPIVLTTATTVAGLIPLIFSGTTMWPPMAWPIIIGLLTSTALTLFVVPALCRLMLKPKNEPIPEPPKNTTKGASPMSAKAASTALVALLSTGLWLHDSSSTAHAAAPNQHADISLQRAMQAASQHPIVLSEQFQHQASLALLQTQQRAAWWPQLNINYRILNVDSLPRINTPAGSFTLGEHRSQRAEISLSQPILQLHRSEYLIPAAAADAEAQRQQALRSADAAAITAATLYLNQLKLQTQRRANDALETSFNARLAKVQALVEGGRALQADALDVRLARNESRQALAQINTQMRILAAQLQRATGLPKAGFLSLPEPNHSVELPERDDAEALALLHRPELAAIKAQDQALDLRAKATNAEGWPTLGAQLSYIHSDGDPLAPDEDFRAALNLQWQAFAGGTRDSRIDALRAQQIRAKMLLEDQRRSINVEIETAYQNLQLALTSKQLAQAAVESAQSRLQTRGHRYDAGRETVDKVLEAEAVLRAQQAKLSEAFYSAIQARLNGRFAIGLTLGQP